MFYCIHWNIQVSHRQLHPNNNQPIAVGIMFCTTLVFVYRFLDVNSGHRLQPKPRVETGWLLTRTSFQPLNFFPGWEKFITRTFFLFLCYFCHYIYFSINDKIFMTITVDAIGRQAFENMVFMFTSRLLR